MYFIYIITNKSNWVLHTGVTNNLFRRMEQHFTKFNPKSFSAKYNVSKLVYYECFEDPGSAIDREKQLKSGSRAKKIKLIETLNPTWEIYWTR